jgi:DNA repair photolyase
MAFSWEDISITRDNGEIVKGKAPVIISASRSTDIPAFFAKWLFKRLEKGYCTWYNPFNKSQPYFVSFKNTKVIVFWTKNPEPIIPYLEKLDQIGINYYFQFTLNDYEHEGFEPNIPKIEKRIETFKKLSGLIGKEKVIWRFDPLILSEKLNVRDLLTKIWTVGNQIKGYTDKLVFSFADINVYKKVQNNLIRETTLYSKENLEGAEFTNDNVEEFIIGLNKIREAWQKDGWEIELATCSEKIDLAKYNIEHNKCIDGTLMAKLFSDDSDLMYFLTYGKLPEKIYNLFDKQSVNIQNMKDKGQRKECGCIFSKDIGMYDTCKHHCVYCYANTSRTVVEKNFALHNLDSESIID